MGHLDYLHNESNQADRDWEFATQLKMEQDLDAIRRRVAGGGSSRSQPTQSKGLLWWLILIVSIYYFFLRPLGLTLTSHW
jgi:hypothetical protein